MSYIAFNLKAPFSKNHLG